ncbi:MAG: gliding motility lipoprotein GldD [Cytophagaceae bacterium]|jgi:gliding motility-associated lipoprotein GldD|nr:gliding motility lipoprotein GldD [Cytophagaceae bacterium]
MKKPLVNSIYFILFSTIVLYNCSTSVEFTPKPKGYNHIELPVHAYTDLQEKHPYSFEHSTLVKVLPDTSYLAEPHWIDLYYPKFNSNIQITYKSMGARQDVLDEHVVDAHKLTYKHDVKAHAIDEVVVKTKKGYSVTLFELQGEVPSPIQFYVTDSTRHFLRGAVYFKTATKNDSLAPVIQYMKEDVLHLIETLDFE